MPSHKKITPPYPELNEDYLAQISLASDVIDFSELQERADREGFKRNTDFHISVMGFESADAVKEALLRLNQPKQDKLLKRIEDLFQSHNWSFKLSQCFHVKKSGNFNAKRENTEDRESYIQLVYLPAMEKFCKKLNKLLKTNLPTQIPHITLFTKGEGKNPDYYGIPIPSAEEFKSLGPEEI